MGICTCYSNCAGAYPGMSYNFIIIGKITRKNWSDGLKLHLKMWVKSFREESC